MFVKELQDSMLVYTFQLSRGALTAITVSQGACVPPLLSRVRHRFEMGWRGHVLTLLSRLEVFGCQWVKEA